MPHAHPQLLRRTLTVTTNNLWVVNLRVRNGLPLSSQKFQYDWACGYFADIRRTRRERELLGRGSADRFKSCCAACQK
jgi:hypothetical protein